MKKNNLVPIIAGLVLIIGLVLAIFLMKKATKQEEFIPDEPVAVEPATEVEPEPEAVDEETPEEIVVSNVVISDPQEDTQEEVGSNVNVADIVDASIVGENSNVTYGIDVSRFQGTIDWAQVASTGIDFAMVRVGYRDSTTGEITADSNGKFNMQEAEKNGIKVGAYFFSTAVSTDEAVEEAKWVADYISQYPITYPVGFNCEGFEKASSRQNGLTKDQRSNIAMAFLDQVYKSGYTPIFYASRNELIGDMKWNTSTIEKSYKIWMAWYNQDTSRIATGPDYAGSCAMWQYTNQGTIAGIKGKVDVDVAYFGYDGTESAKNTAERETVSADVEALMKFTDTNEIVTSKDSTNLRDIPSQGSDSKVMYTLKNGETATRTGISDSGWSRVVFGDKTYYAVSSYLTTNLEAKAPSTDSQPAEQTSSGFKTKFTDCSDQVTPKEEINLRNKPSVTDADSQVVATVYAGTVINRTGYNTEYGWSRVEYEGQTLYCVTSYLNKVE